MTKFKREVRVNLDEDKQIVIKRKKKSDGTFSVIGSVIEYSGEYRKPEKSRKRTAHNQADAELVTQELIRFFSSQSSQSEMRHTGKAADCNGPLHNAVRVLSGAAESIVDPGWGLRTQDRSVKYFERHFLDAILTGKDVESLQIQIDEIHQQLIAKAVENKRSKGIRKRAEQSVANECYRAQKVYQYLRDTNPELNLPDVNLSMNVLRSSVMPEQAKSLPDLIVLRFANVIEGTIQNNPCYALAAMLMLCAALRTSEACGVMPDRIKMCDDYAVVPVLYQVQNGKLSEILKTEDSYRTVVLPFWAMHIAAECIRVMKDSGIAVTENHPLVEDPGAFAGWVLRNLKECGLTDKMMEAARNLMREETNSEVFSMDISAYLLRRNCASGWRNICALNGDAIDYLLGHKRRTLTSSQQDYRLPEQQEKLAIRLERIVYSKQFTRHPGYQPYMLEHEMDCKLIPFDRYSFVNHTNEPIQLTISLTGVMPGDSFSLKGTEEKKIEQKRRRATADDCSEVIGLFVQNDREA